MSTKTIFLSHSGKDIEKVRKIRDILEALEYEPLIFHLKCLDDDNEMLEDFIKKEIDARNIFVYCKSQNSEASVWVQKELEYIRSSSNKRLYEFNIERPLSETLVSFLHTLAEIVKKNKVFLSCSHKDRVISDIVTRCLESGGYEVIRYNTFNETETAQHERDLGFIAENGLFVPLITKNYLNSVFCMSEMEKILYDGIRKKVLFKPVYVNILPILAQTHMPSAARDYAEYHLGNPECLTSDDMDALLQFISSPIHTDR